MSSERMCEVSKKLHDLEQRSVIKFLTKEGKKPKEIFECMVAVYRESAPSYYKVNFGVNNLSGEASRLKMTLTMGILWK